jgi:hypothetical protein
MARFPSALLSTLVAAVSLLIPPPTSADEPGPDTAAKPIAGWQHAGHVWLLTDSEGADLPADALLHDVPVVVRLDDEFFDFAAAQPHGEDLRLTSDAGTLLPHEIETWDRESGKAVVWVRVPEIRGQARQRLTLHWGNPDAPSVSDGTAVFNAANGHVAVFHMGDPVGDATGALESRDTGTEAVVGIVGPARHFPGGHGVFCGDMIPTLPSGSSDHTTQAWLRSEVSNGRAFGWGNEAAQGKVIMNFRSPPHARMECYFSGADVAGQTRLAKATWVHVVHTYTKGESLLYVNGVLDGSTRTDSAPLKIASPARMWIGGWYDQYDFAGDIDEVRVSNVVRPVAWAKLDYENQKPLQSLVGHPVQPGADFDVSRSSLELREGERATVTARAGGAIKVFWGLVRDGEETVVATDTLHHELDADRVTGDTRITLRFRAVYPDGTKTIDIPITIREAIPDPVFTLEAPATWDGREPIRVVPRIANRAALEATGVAALNVHWQSEGPALVEQESPDGLLLERSQNSGRLIVAARIDNGGTPVVATTEILVTEPATDPWIEAPVDTDTDELPVDRQFFARNDKNVGTLHLRGRLDTPADSVFLELFADDALVDSRSLEPDQAGRYAFAIPLTPGLVRYRVECGAVRDGKKTILHTADDLLCGDAYLIDGQSNAVASDWGADQVDDSPDPSIRSWIRSFGAMEGSLEPEWGDAVRREGGKHQIGYWGIDLARHLVDTHKIPICILNGAVGGTRIDQHLPDPADRTNPATIYGRLLARVRAARLTHGLRAVLWHQGEADQGADGPDGGYGSETYRQHFHALAAHWQRDMPNLGHTFLFQIWPNACSQGGTPASDRLRDIQRTLPRDFARMSVMSTLGIRPEGGCHYPAAGYAEMARLMAALVDQRCYGTVFAEPVTAPDLISARYADDTRAEILLEFGQPIDWSDATASEFRLDGEPGGIRSGEATGSTLRLSVAPGCGAATITYLVDRQWHPDRVLRGTNGIAALTFHAVSIEPPPAQAPSP